MSLTQPQTEASASMYLYVIGGKMMQSANEGDQGAKLRKYELSDGTKGEKWEIEHRNLTGLISKVEFKDTDYGENCIVSITDGEETAKLTLGTAGKYFPSFAKMLPNINLTEEVTINSYDFKSKDNGKQKTGLSITQDGKKVQDYYYDGKKNINGFPTPEGDVKKYKSDDWKVYFISVKKFLVAEVQKVEFPDFTGENSQEATPEVAAEVFDDSSFE